MELLGRRRFVLFGSEPSPTNSSRTIQNPVSAQERIQGVSLAPKIFSKSCSFQGKPLFWAQGPPFGVKTPLGPPDQNPGSGPVAPAKAAAKASGNSKRANLRAWTGTLDRRDCIIRRDAVSVVMTETFDTCTGNFQTGSTPVFASNTGLFFAKIASCKKHRNTKGILNCSMQTSGTLWEEVPQVQMCAFFSLA